MRCFTHFLKAYFKGDKMLDDIIDLMIRVTFLGALICATIGLFGLAAKVVMELIK